MVSAILQRALRRLLRRRLRRGARGRLPRHVGLQLQSLSHTPMSAQLQESAPELRTHYVVQDRIHGGIDVEHDPREVEDVVVPLQAHVHARPSGSHDDPHGKGSERKQTGEEGEHDGAQHHYHLFPVLDDAVRGGVAASGRDSHVGVRHQRLGDQGVDTDQDGQGEYEKYHYGAYEEYTREEIFHQRETDEDYGSVEVLLRAVLGDGEYGAGKIQEYQFI